MERKRKKLVQINTVCNTSTGRIMGDIQREAIRRGYESVSFVGRRKTFSDVPCEKIGGFFSFWMHVGITTVFDRQGFGSLFMTKKLVRRIKEENPDIIHLHNLHGYYLNLPTLLYYIKNEFKGQLFWTFHDCWPFTGHCAYFTMAGCAKWKRKCQKCPNKRRYPVSLLFDASEKNYEDKKGLLCGIGNLKIIVPSHWMAELVHESFMKEYPVEVIPNGINVTSFSHTQNTDIYIKYNIPAGKKILLGVANIWDERKGLRTFMELSKELTDEYQIVLVGLSRGQIKKMPENVTGIRKIESLQELAALYSLAQVFINPSVEESFSLVTVEAFACGTPVIVLDTSAVKELVTSKNGIVLSKYGVKEYVKAVKKLESLNLNRKTIAECAKKYDVQNMLSHIFALYESVQ